MNYEDDNNSDSGNDHDFEQADKEDIIDDVIDIKDIENLDFRKLRKKI